MQKRVLARKNSALIQTQMRQFSGHRLSKNFYTCVFAYLYRLKLQKNCVLHSSQFDNDGVFLPHLATRQATVSDGQWRIFRVLSEHLKMTKKINKIGFRAFITD